MIPSLLFTLFACGEKDDLEGKEITAEPSVEETGEDTEDSGEDTDTEDLEDADNDGFTVEDGDCDDNDADINPDAEDIPGDGIDQDCEGGDAVLDAIEIGIDDLEEGDLVITEIMKDPAAVAQEVGEWFEIYNATNTIIDLERLEVRDDGVDTFTISESVLVNPGQYVVFGANGAPSTNGGAEVHFAYNRSDFSLGNDSDEIVLVTSQGEIDRVDYNDTLFPDSDGMAMSLDTNFSNAIDNDDGQHWCDAEDSFGDGDSGTPAGVNPNCSVSSDNDGDGYGSDVDCDDDNPSINPGEIDNICNGIDADCDTNIDEDWSENITTGIVYEPNQDTGTAYHLGTDPNIYGEISASTADLDTSGTLSVTAFLFDDADVDTFVFTSYDQVTTDGGFDVIVDSVPAGVDIAIAIDFMDEDGVLTTDVVVQNDAGPGGAESACYSDAFNISCSNSGYSSGTYFVRVYSMAGSDCLDSYELSIVD